MLIEMPLSINFIYVARNSFLKLYEATSLSSVQIQFLCMRCTNLSEETKACTPISAFKYSLTIYQFLYSFSNNINAIISGHTSLFSLC